MHFKWENPCRIRHRIENIKSLDEEKISDEPKWNRIEAELENTPCILNGKKPCRIRHRIEKIKSLTKRINLSSRKGTEFIPNLKTAHAF